MHQRERLIVNLASAGTQNGLRVMVWYSGAPVYRYDFWSDTEYMLTLSTKPGDVNLGRMKGAALLKDHNRSIDNQIGVIERAWMEDGQGMAEYRFAETEDVDVIRAKVDDGIIRNVSMEAVVEDTRDVTPKGSKMKQILATSWYPEAVALVPVGADPNAKLFSEEESSGLWLPDGLYTPKFSDAGAAREEEQRPAHSGSLTALLLSRR